MTVIISQQLEGKRSLSGCMRRCIVIQKESKKKRRVHHGSATQVNHTNGVQEMLVRPVYGNGLQQVSGAKETEDWYLVRVGRVTSTGASRSRVFDLYMGLSDTKQLDRAFDALEASVDGLVLIVHLAPLSLADPDTHNKCTQFYSFRVTADVHACCNPDEARHYVLSVTDTDATVLLHAAVEIKTATRKIQSMKQTYLFHVHVNWSHKTKMFFFIRFMDQTLTRLLYHLLTECKCNIMLPS